MKRICKKIVVLVMVVFVILLVAFYCTWFIVPSEFSDSYQKGFNYQYNALKNATDKPKLIVLGGSYMTFAINSELLSDMTNQPAYTLGIHSGMGICYTVETAKKFINKDDVVVFSFADFERIDYGMDLIYLCFEGDKKMFFDFFKKHPLIVIKSFSNAIYTKINHRIYMILRSVIFHKTGNVETVYSSLSFDKNTGNLIYPRPTIEEKFSNFEFDKNVKYDTSQIDMRYIELLNSLNTFCEKHNAKLLITFSPVYKDVISNTETEMKEYERYLSEILSGTVISTVSDNLMPKDCIYNGFWHMNDKGAEKYTKQLYNDLCKFKIVR